MEECESRRRCGRGSRRAREAGVYGLQMWRNGVLAGAMRSLNPALAGWHRGEREPGPDSLVPGAWPRRVSLEEPERRWRGGSKGLDVSVLMVWRPGSHTKLQSSPREQKREGGREVDRQKAW
ncbi:hypothetical protein NQZ68_035559 [Dissostichus eleginoides]|nr:hypothetical protein NQZ68_035559 [Dissostichus eleginoides]